MIIDGKAIAADILVGVRSGVTQLATPPRLTVFTCAPNFETQKFLNLKQKRAHEVGIIVQVILLPEASTTEMVVAAIENEVVHTDGIIVQLPFPEHIAVATILKAVPVNHDVDALSYVGGDTVVLPPVAGAIDAIARVHTVDWAGKQVVVVGNGRLVGAPAAAYAETKGAVVTVVVKDTPNTAEAIAAADILILGAGVPGLITPAMVAPSVVVFDAGTSEEGGMLVGDAVPAVADKASIFTPVPGGIGPITIAILLKNVLYLAQQHRKKDPLVV
jgi:methylenetetrahydrofolate dehydrogenase (NADP+)/methenyltetrahydrofolate cyclohydrolase